MRNTGSTDSTVGKWAYILGRQAVYMLPSQTGVQLVVCRSTPLINIQTNTRSDMIHASNYPDSMNITRGRTEVIHRFGVIITTKCHTSTSSEIT